jgi:hypothetical protein
MADKYTSQLTTKSPLLTTDQLSVAAAGATGAGSLKKTTVQDVIDLVPVSGGAQVVAFSSSIPFDAPFKLMSEVISGPINFTPNETGAVAGNGTVVRIVGDGTNTPTYDTQFKKASTSDDPNNATGTVQEIVFTYNGHEYCYSIRTITVIDIANPTLVSASVEEANPDQIVYIYDEALDEASVPAPSDFDAVGSVSGAKTATAVDVTGTTVTVTYDEDFDATDVITTDYTPGTNKIQDTSGNLASALSAQAVINHISTEVDFAKGYGDVDGNIVVEGTGFKKTAVAATNDIISDTTHTIAIGGHFRLKVDNNTGRIWFGFIGGSNVTPTPAVNQFLHGFLLWDTNGVYTYENGSFTGSSYGTVSVGDDFRVWYENSTTVKFQKSTDNGATWTTIRTSGLNPASASYRAAIMFETQNVEVANTKLKLS